MLFVFGRIDGGIFWLGLIVMKNGIVKLVFLMVFSIFFVELILMMIVVIFVKLVWNMLICLCVVRKVLISVGLIVIFNRFM